MSACKGAQGSRCLSTFDLTQPTGQTTTPRGAPFLHEQCVGSLTCQGDYKNTEGLCDGSFDFKSIREERKVYPFADVLTKAAVSP